MTQRVFIIHGWGGSPDDDWLPWLKSEFEKQDLEVIVLTMPHTETPIIEDWVTHLAGVVGKPDEETYFVGHSIGCQTIMRYLESLPANGKVGGAVFVAGWFNLVNLSDPEADEIAKPWLTNPIGYDKVKTQLRQPLIALFSDNDPWVPVSDEQLFKQRLNARTKILHDKGHLTTDDNVLEVPEVFVEIMKLVLHSSLGKGK